MSHWQMAFKRCAWITALFCAVTLAMLSWNAFASRAIDPNPPTRVDELVTRINLDPNNKELLTQLRKEDVYLRSSYFRSIRFAQSGFYLLVGGVALFLLFAKLADKVNAAPIQPDPNAPMKAASDALDSQRVLVAVGIGLGGLLALVATLSRHDTVAAYVDARPLPQVTPLAPVSSQGLPPAVPTMNSVAPSAALTTRVAGPTPLGGTSLVPLPLTTPPPPVITAKLGPSGLKATLGPAADSGWACFRGPNSGTAPSWAEPADWDATTGKGVLWKVNLNLPGWNSPIVSRNRVFLSGADESHREISAFDLETGRPVWRLAIPSVDSTQKPSADAGYAPSTMATDGSRVFAAFVDGSVVCVTTDGKPVWTRSFGPLENSYGFASSLLCVGGKLIVQMDQGSSPDQGKSRLYGLEPASGVSVWETKRATSAAWSSPIALNVNGKLAVVVVGAPSVALYDVATGAELWHTDGLSGEIAPSAVVGDGRIFAGQQGSVLMAVSAGDGKMAWSTADPALPEISSPAYSHGMLFFTTSDGTTSAVDGGTGKIVWEKRLEKVSRASPVVAGENVYLLGIDGVMRVFKASRTFSLVGQHRLGEPAEATPVFVGGRMILRGEHHLFCVGAK